MDANAQPAPRRRVSLTLQLGGDNDVISLGSQSTRPSGKTPPTGYDIENSNNQSEETKSEETPLIDGNHCNQDDTIVSKGNEADDKGATKFTTGEKIIFLCAAFAIFGNWLTFSVMAVFYPVEAKKRGMSQTTIGFVFSTYAFCTSAGSPIFGKLLPIAGARFLFLAGGFLTGSCNILFGFVEDMPDLATFTAFSFIIRILEGTGSAACLTATYAIVVYTFPNHVGTTVSILEMMCGLSLAIGPMLGGLLYSAGGFKLPFFSLGGAVLFIMFLNFWFLPRIGRQNESSGSMRSLLSIPAIWLVISCMILACVGLSGLDPTLSLHLKSLGFNVIERSVMYGVLGFTYASTAVIWGLVADKTKKTRTMIIVGLVGSGVSLSMIGPAPFLPQNKVMPVVAIPLLATFIALVLTPTLVDMVISVEWYGGTSDLGMTAILSGLWNSAFSFGSVFGPLIAGALVDQYGFDLSFSFAAAVFLLYMVFFCLFGAWEFQCGKGRRGGKSRMILENGTVDEETSLLPSKP